MEWETEESEKSTILRMQTIPEIDKSKGSSKYYFGQRNRDN